ncbi:hypothetical protein NLI96_g11890 [Meripilus lineatus]|uniref:Uncharacterized protein n=1 Tax=Meripilus lineatus TaxID=2056292 RepID=A0AAD5UQX2_9APHY|nr:hypothetical protein NLI96_g11890 [Physisporinus lineatus]
MVNWNSPEEIARDEVIVERLIHIVCGVYLWEFTISLDFEWSLVTFRKRFTWPLVPYFLSHYFALGVTIAFLFLMDAHTHLDCRAIISFMAVGTGSMAGFNRLPRMVVWSMDQRCVVPLCLLLASHWGVILWGVIETGGFWQPGVGCIRYTSNLAVLVTFICAICVDAIVLALCAIKLIGIANAWSRLPNLLFKDGLIYFIVVLLSSLPSAIMVGLHLNPVMDVMLATPATYITVIAACRAVRHLSDYSNDTPAIVMSLSAPRLPGRLFTRNVTRRASLPVMITEPRQSIHIDVNTRGLTGGVLLSVPPFYEKCIEFPSNPTSLDSDHIA